MKPSKAELRHNLKQARLAISLTQRQRNSLLIKSSLLQSIDWSNVSTIHCFEPIESLGEVDIDGFIQGKQLFTSRLIEGKWQIVSVNDNQEAPHKFDVIIVPMLGFDKRLHRIGYGGGYYDRLLKEHPEAQKIGVCFEASKVEQIPDEPHDIALDIIVTEAATYQ